MGKPKDINEIAEEIKNWEVLTKLPQTIDGFSLQPGTGIDGQILNIAAYVNEAMHCRLDFTYTKETFDYVPVKTVGLHTFRDERYFCRDREHFGELLLTQLPQMIKAVDRNTRHKMPYESLALGFDTWEYWKSLPQELEGYELFITPDNPLPYINGSYIFLDYADFTAGNEIYFSYNIFRDELFAEMHKRYLPLTTEQFDVKAAVPSENKLGALEQHIKEHLEEFLHALKKD